MEDISTRVYRLPSQGQLHFSPYSERKNKMENLMSLICNFDHTYSRVGDCDPSEGDQSSSAV